jgi:hypothetical protein
VGEIAYFPAYYSPREDVRMELLVPNRHTHESASRGTAHTSPSRAGHDRSMKFFNEMTDFIVDGEPQERPTTRFS